jgi:Outer membrane protein beta-barrel domain
MHRQGIVLMAMATLILSSAETRAETVWGVKGGLVRAALDVQGPGAFTTEADAGGTIGAFVGVDLSKSVRLQPEVLFTKERFSAKELAAPFGIAARSIEVPLLIQARFFRDRRVQAVLYSGPRLGFISKVTEALEGAPSEIDLSDQIKDLDAGVALGGGVETALGRGALLFEARFDLGLRNLSEAPDVTFKSRAFLALVGYRF